jgi:heme A synthase
MIALVGGSYVLASAVIAAFARRGRGTRRLAAIVVALYLLQVVAGFTNIYLRAPVWLQLLHLLLADAIWISLVCLAASVFAAPEAEPVARTEPALARI